ncbi:hypothetical protein B0H13DRAFT_2305216 [Mycena leptocephala]|nr:hypothetical protein B0H13DRAFT_2305216 [Mycena leptocephala]
MAAAPAPQWALDLHNVLRHDIFWNNEIMRITEHNTQLTIRQQQVLASWAAARGLNASCDRDFEPLQALPMPLALIPVPVAPAPLPQGPPWSSPLLLLPPQSHFPRHTFSSRRTRERSVA